MATVRYVVPGKGCLSKSMGIRVLYLCSLPWKILHNNILSLADVFGLNFVV